MEGFGWALLGGMILIPLAIFGVMSLVGVGLEWAVPDSPVRMAEEYVEIELAPGSVRVSATYAFLNDTWGDETLALAYPFGRGRGVGPAENVALADGAGKEIPFAWEGGQGHFRSFGAAEKLRPGLRVVRAGGERCGLHVPFRQGPVLGPPGRGHHLRRQGAGGAGQRQLRLLLEKSRGR